MAKAKRKNAGSKSTEVDTSGRGFLRDDLPSSRSKPYSKNVELRTPDRVILPDTEYIDAERRAKQAANKALKRKKKKTATPSAAGHFSEQGSSAANPVGRPATVAKAGTGRRQVSFLVAADDYELLEAFAKANGYKSVAAAGRHIMLTNLRKTRAPR